MNQKTGLIISPVFCFLCGSSSLCIYSKIQPINFNLLDIECKVIVF